MKSAQSCIGFKRTLTFLLMNTLILLRNKFVAAASASEPFTRGTVATESFFVRFLERMQEKGVDNIELSDFIFFGIFILCALELLNFSVKRGGCE